MAHQGFKKTQRVPTTPTLEVTNNYNTSTIIFPLTNAKLEFTIGRHPTSDICVDFDFVSGSHLTIERAGDQFAVVHPAKGRAQTMNGLICNGQRIAGNEQFRKILARGDVFRIGDDVGTQVTITFDEEEALSAAPDVRPIPLGMGKITLGREKNNTIVLAHPQISGHHAQLIPEKGSYRIIDLSSTNHMYVNGQLSTSHLLTVNDEIRIGPYKFIFTGNRMIQHDESSSISIEARGLKQYGNNGAVLLHDISFTVPPRKFVALVGGSGAGKSTLLNALSGFRLAAEGAVFYNGQDYYASLDALRTQIGYVPQDDIVHRDLTVERALYYASRMRLPDDFSKRQILQRINEVLEEVELREQRHLRISQLSGGQRKRVSIALELLAKPTIFFLDEPTSGLDAGLDRKMMLLLRKLKDKGHTIILVTHAISNITFCDFVCFLAPGGYLAYFGPPQGAPAYFGKDDFAEIYTALEPTLQNPDVPREAGERFRQYQGGLSSSPRSTVPIQTKRPKRARSWRQFWLLSMRYFELLKNDRTNLGIMLLQAPIIGLMLVGFILGIGTGGFDANNVVQCPTTSAILTKTGLPDLPNSYNPPVSKSCQRLESFLTSDPRGKIHAHTRGGVQNALQDFIILGPGYAPTILFIMAFSAIMFGCINAAREVVKEEAIYRRERAVNLGILAYLFSKIGVLSILCLLQSLVLVTLVSVVDPFHQGVFLPPFLEVYITIALTSLVGLMMGLTVSSLAPNTDRAMSLIPLLLIPQVIFSGTIFPLTQWGLQIPGALFPIRWAMAALGSSVGLHSDKINGDALFGTMSTYHGTLFSTYEKSDAVHYILFTWLVLALMFLTLTFVCAMSLKWKDIRK